MTRTAPPAAANRISVSAFASMLAHRVVTTRIMLSTISTPLVAIAILIVRAVQIMLGSG
jgi:hypothetical protein